MQSPVRASILPNRGAGDRLRRPGGRSRETPPYPDRNDGCGSYLAAIRGGDFASAAAIAEISGFMK
jgi:hypothetical protein